MARKGENIYKRKDGRWRHDMKKAEKSPRDRLSTALCNGKSYREVREKKINSIVKLPVKDHFAVRI